MAASSQLALNHIFTFFTQRQRLDVWCWISSSVFSLTKVSEKGSLAKWLFFLTILTWNRWNNKKVNTGVTYGITDCSELFISKAIITVITNTCVTKLLWYAVKEGQSKKVSPRFGLPASYGMPPRPSKNKRGSLELWPRNVNFTEKNIFCYIELTQQIWSYFTSISYFTACAILISYRLDVLHANIDMLTLTC